jgi:hypothetical protein
VGRAAAQRELGPEHRAQLEALGFVWNPFADDWEQAHAALTAYVAEHGHARVPRDHVTQNGFG